jgi:hypothetical protein
MNQHSMQLEKTQPSGEEEWFCPTCGRRFLLRLSPSYSKTVLERGDEYASHTGGSLDFQIGTMNISQKAEAKPPLSAPDIEKNIGESQAVEMSPSLLKWLKEAGLEKLI